jgi:hypothetical protein
MSRALSWVACLGLACVPFWPLAARATTQETELGDGATLCGSYFWFNVVGPKGWTRESGLLEDDDYVRWDPPGSATSITAYLHVESGRRQDRSSDPLDIVRWKLRYFAINGLSAPTRDTDVRHPTLPSAAARMTAPVGSATLVGVVAAAEQERAAYWTFLLISPGTAPAADLRAFRATVQSLRFDPKRGCDREQKRVAYQPTPALPKSPSRKPGAKRPFSLKDSLAGATLVERMMMPVTATIVTVDGRKAYLIEFAPDRGKTRADYVEHFAPTIAASYCWEASAAQRKDQVPLLVFAADEPSHVRRWDCEREALGPPQSAAISPVAPLALEIGGHAGTKGAAITCSGGRLSCAK